MISGAIASVPRVYPTEGAYIKLIDLPHSGCLDRSKEYFFRVKVSPDVNVCKKMEDEKKLFRLKNEGDGYCSIY